MEASDADGRLLVLEKKLRRQQGWFIVMAAVVALGGLTALRPSQDGVITARRLEIRDEQGALVGYFGFPAQSVEDKYIDGVGLGWYIAARDDTSCALLSLESDEEGGSIPLLELQTRSGGSNIARMAASPAETGFKASFGEQRSALLLVDGDNTRLQLSSGGAARVEVEGEEESESDESIESRILIQLDDNKPLMEGRGRDGKPVFRLPGR